MGNAPDPVYRAYHSAAAANRAVAAAVAAGQVNEPQRAALAKTIEAASEADAHYKAMVAQHGWGSGKTRKKHAAVTGEVAVPVIPPAIEAATTLWDKCTNSMDTADYTSTGTFENNDCGRRTITFLRRRHHCIRLTRASRQ